MAGLSLRRTRLGEAVRELTREVRPQSNQFVQPLFVVEGLREREAVPGLNQVWRETQDSLLRQIEADKAVGVSKFLLFSVPAAKTDHAFEHEFAATQIAAVKKAFGDDIWLATDVCLCSSTTHGHCGVLSESGDSVENAPSVAALASEALEFARAGANCVAPSDMMDGRVGAIREGLDAEGFDDTVIMSYSAKFHSGFYGPFRVTAESAPAAHGLSDRASYQIDPTRPSDALLSSRRDAAEGADILMVKPALPYLDVLRELSNEIRLPWAAYQTSGEAAGLRLLADNQLADLARVNVEAWVAMMRAGANFVISYDARHAGDWLAQAKL